MPKFTLHFPTAGSCLIAAALSFLSSCTDKQSELNPTGSDAAYFVSLEQAQVVAQNIAASEQVLAQYKYSRLKRDTQQVFAGLETIRTAMPIEGTDGKPAFYVFNYDRGGYAVIAADRHMKPVLAFNERGQFRLSDKATALVEGASMWMEQTKAIVTALRANPSEKNADPAAKQTWDKLTAVTLLPNQPRLQGATGPESRPLPDEPVPDPCYSNQIGPLVQTSWGQSCGYNSLCPPASNGSCGYCVTGCVATAMAQVMHYWKHPASFNWSAMPVNYGTYDVAALMRSCGNAVGMQYGATSSGASAQDVPGALSSLGYSSVSYNGNYGSGGYSTVKYNLARNQPVLLWGYNKDGGWFSGASEGHLWVCDGYIDSLCNGYGYLYFHMNWGWDGSYNGWYAYNNWTIQQSNGSTLNFQYSQHMVDNIHP